MDRWLFIHIMKTAGTSFRTMLEDTPEAAIYPTEEELARRPNRWYPTAPELLERVGRGEIDLSTRRFLCGHYAAGLSDHLPGRWRRVTFLRDPVRRSLSMIAHRHFKESRLNRFLKPNISKYLDREDFVERQIRNYQTKVLALDGRENVNLVHPIDEAAFGRAEARLHEIDLVGLTERFAESVRLLEGMAGIRFAALVHQNKSRGYAASEAEVERIRALVPFDLALYEIASRKLSTQLDAAA